MRLAVAVFGATLLLPGAPRLLSAQGQMDWSECDIAPGTTHSVRSGFAGQTRLRILTPRLVCADGTRIQADSALVLEFDRTATFWGNVRFSDRTSVLTAPYAKYWEWGDSLVASGGARLDAPSSGSLAEAPILTYLQIGAYRAIDTLRLWGGLTHSVLKTRGGSSTAGGFGLGMDRRADAATDSVGVAGSGGVAVGVDTTGAAGAGAIATDSIDSPPTTPLVVRPPRTYDVVALGQLMAGEESFHSWGDVVITRDSVVATADSAHMDQAQERLFLRGSASVAMPERELTGHTITAFLPGGDLREVIARQDARLLAEELDMEGPNIFLELVLGQVQSVVAWRTRAAAVPPPPDSSAVAPPPDSVGAADTTTVVTGVGVGGGRAGGLPPPPGTPPVAVVEPPDPRVEPEGVGEPEVETGARVLARGFRMHGDSIHVETPGGVIQRLFAQGGVTGRARLDILGRDSLTREDTPLQLREDWIEGDSILAIFRAPSADSVDAVPVPPDSLVRADAPADSLAPSGNSELERLEAHGRARALYRMVPQSGLDSLQIVTDSLTRMNTVPPPAGSAGAAAGAAAGAVAGEEGAVAGDSARAAAPAFSVHYIAEAQSLVLYITDGVLRRIEIEGPAHALVLDPVRGGRGGRGGGTGVSGGGARAGGGR